MTTFSLEGGKYEVDRDERGLLAAIRRLGEPWPEAMNQLQFSKLFHAALDRIESLENAPRACEHTYDYQGLVTWPSEDPLPGSGAYARIYADAFFCTRCCAMRLANERQTGNTYMKALDGAVQYERRPA
jgi:hypothetical protein